VVVVVVDFFFTVILTYYFNRYYLYYHSYSYYYYQYLHDILVPGITIFFKQEIAKNSRWEELGRNVRWESIGPCECQRLIWNQPLGGQILRIRYGSNVICPLATRPISMNEGILMNFENIDEFQTLKYEDAEGNERKLCAKVSYGSSSNGSSNSSSSVIVIVMTLIV